MYRIYERYQYWGQEGIVWTNWFKSMGKGKFKTREEAQAEMDKLNKEEKRKKLKHEYKVEEE